VIIPDENKKDLAEIPKNITDALTIHPVRWIDQVLDLALENPLKPLPEQAAVVAGAGEMAADVKHESVEDASSARTH